MKSLKEYFSQNENSEITESGKALLAKPMDPPPVLIMRRQSIRQFGNGQRVAIYHVDKLNKYVTVPYTEMGWASEEIELDGIQLEESVFDILRFIVENDVSQTINFQDGSSMKVDVRTANAILRVHGALNEENKQTIFEMAHKSKDDFKKIANFAGKQVTYKTKD